MSVPKTEQGFRKCEIKIFERKWKEVFIKGKVNRFLWSYYKQEIKQWEQMIDDNKITSLNI